MPALCVWVLGASAMANHPMKDAAVLKERLERVNSEAMQRAVKDMAMRWPERFPDVAVTEARITTIREKLASVKSGVAAGDAQAMREAAELLDFQRATLLAHPLLDDGRVLVVKRGFPDASKARSAMSSALGMAPNFASNVRIPARGHWNDRIVALSDLRGSIQETVKYSPQDGRTITDPAIDFDGKRLLFAMENPAQKNWRIVECLLDDGSLHQVTPDDGAGVGHFDPCVLPDGSILFTSTAGYMGLPCVFGSAPMVCLYRMNRETGEIRQLTFEQDSNWSPVALPNGRVLYQRWEYSDIAHSNTRLLMHMNPDGTDQREFYGSGSYFPPSLFYARPVPGHPRMVAAIATGHHGTHRSGRLLLIDPSRGRREAEGIVQEIPGYQKPVEPIVRDRLVDGVWPQFLHPYPLDERTLLVSMKPSPTALWGLYLVDVFDNLVLIHESEQDAMLWPIPLRESPRPPIVHDRVNTTKNDGTMLMVDVYQGEGLHGIPHGTIKSLRIFEYYFSYRDVGGLLGSIGMDGPWDIKRSLGTVPVEKDGSAFFTLPANKPVAIQALDEQGQAVQLMRSWTVLQPGERSSCIGCHESQNASPPLTMPLAAFRDPSTLHRTWEEPVRGFSYEREVQPVLNRHCVGCHDNSSGNRAEQAPYLAGDKRVTDWHSALSGSVPPANIKSGKGFTESYVQLHRFVRRPGIESDIRMLTPMEYHFSTTELGQMLRKGHHGVELDQESLARLVTWVDLNAPFHGTWGEIVGPKGAAEVRATQEQAHRLRALYAPRGPAEDYEKIPPLPAYDESFQRPTAPLHQEHPVLSADGWPFDEAGAQRVQKAAGIPHGDVVMKIPLGEGPVFPTAYLGHDDNRPAVASGPQFIELSLIPGGKFVMGSTAGHPDEAPPAIVEIEPFWMASCEINNAQFRMYDPSHQSRDESRHGYQFGRRGFYQDEPNQPAVRVSWIEARAFCEWLSQKSGMAFDLPTEGQWEWAARAGSALPFHFGAIDSDHAAFANLADVALKEYVQCTAQGNYTLAVPVKNPNRYDDWIPRGDHFNDGALITTTVRRYRPNAWGLHDMHGNAAEWTRSTYTPYPYRPDDGRNNPDNTLSERVVRGGSWRDRPHQATASFRRPYKAYQRVYNVGFRVVAPIQPPAQASTDNAR